MIFKLILKRVWKALKTTCPLDVGKVFGEIWLRYGFIMYLAFRGVLFTFPKEFKRAPVDRPKIAWNLPAHPPGPLAEVSQQQDFRIIR